MVEVEGFGAFVGFLVLRVIAGDFRFGGGGLKTGIIRAPYFSFNPAAGFSLRICFISNR